jgi:hypothetical protein
MFVAIMSEDCLEERDGRLDDPKLVMRDGIGASALMDGLCTRSSRELRYKHLEHGIGAVLIVLAYTYEARLARASRDSHGTAGGRTRV